MREFLPRLVEVFVLWFWALGLALAVWWASRATVSSRRLPVRSPLPESRWWWALPVSLATAFGLLLLWREDFAGHDDSFFTTMTLIGRNIPSPVWRADGRFWPLGYQEFNLIGKVTSSVVGYHVWPIVQLVLVVSLSWFVLRDLPRWVRIGTVTSILLTPSIALTFAGLVYPERNVVFFVALVLAATVAWDRAPSRRLLVVGLVATQFLLYYKELAFVWVSLFAMGRVLLRRRFSPGPDSTLSTLERGWLALAAAFVGLFVAMQLGDANLRYATRMAEPFPLVLWSYATSDPLVFLLIGVVAVRATLLARRRGQPDVLWDAAAIAAVAYALAVFALRIRREYLLAPVDFLALLYSARLGSAWLRGAAWQRVFVVGSAAVIVATFGTLTTVGQTYRKARIISRSLLADVLLREVGGADRDTVDVHFPYTSSYELMELAAYLRYRGLHIERVDDSGLVVPRGPLVRLTAPHSFSERRCVWWRRMVCYSRPSPEPGAYVVVLPDDLVEASTPAAVPEGYDKVSSIPIMPGATRLLETLGPFSAAFGNAAPARASSAIEWRLEVFRSP